MNRDSEILPRSVLFFMDYLKEFVDTLQKKAIDGQNIIDHIQQILNTNKTFVGNHPVSIVRKTMAEFFYVHPV